MAEEKGNVRSHTICCKYSRGARVSISRKTMTRLLPQKTGKRFV
jgi:hypothetical protein